MNSLFPTPQDFPLPPPPSWDQHASMVICILAIFLPSGPIRLSTGLILLAQLFHITFWTESATYNDYTVATTGMTTLFAWVDFIASHKLERDFWKTVKDDQGHIVEERVPDGAWAKLEWSILFWFGYRKIGWNIQISSIPPSVPANYPRGRFLTDLLFKSFKMYLGLDLACLILRELGHSRTSPDFFSEPLTSQVLTGWATASRAYCGMSLIYQLAAFLSVLLSLTSPSSWPPVNGSFRENFFSVRKSWGKLWHQFIRRYCTSAGLAVTKMCGFRKGSFMSRYTQLWVGFMVTALMHHPPAVRWADRGFWQAMAFLSQPAAIMVEDFVVLGGKRMGLRDSAWTRGVGFLWVFLWFSWTLRWWVATVPLTFAEGDELPSLHRYLLRRYGQKSL